MKSKNESIFRVILAREHLQDARFELNARRYPKCVQSAQLSIENSAKSLVEAFGISSQEHDVRELGQILKEKEDELIKKVDIAPLSKVYELAVHYTPDHIKTVYGDEKRMIPPSGLYDYHYAVEISRDAEFAYKTALGFLESFYDEKINLDEWKERLKE